VSVTSAPGAIGPAICQARSRSAALQPSVTVTPAWGAGTIPVSSASGRSMTVTSNAGAVPVLRTTTRKVRPSSDCAVAGPSVNAPAATLTALSTLTAGSTTVVIDVAGVEVSSNPVGIVAGENAPSRLLRLLATVTELTAVWAATTVAPPLRCVARTCPL
jgi:hypothetical protein